MRNRPLRIALGGLLLAALAALLWIRLDPAAEAEPEQLSGAAEALIFWEMQRAYPSGEFPSEGFMDAFQQRLALDARSAEPGTEWSPMGPTNNGGRTLAVVLNPERPESVWIGSAGGGLWRSYQGGTNASWERVETGFPVTSAATVAIAPTDTNVVYLGTGEVYRYQDTQGGVVDRPTRGSYGIGILKTEDGGTTWSHVLDWSRSQERGVARIRVNPNDADDVWAATTEGVYRSTDGGATWSNLHPVIMAMDLVLHPSDPNWVISAHGDQESVGKGLYRTTDGGTTWTQLTNGVPDDFIGKIILDTHPNPDIVYASVGDGITSSGGTNTTLIRTLDGGDTWETVTTLDYAIYQGWFAHYVGVNPHRPDTVFLAGVPLYRSTNGGFSASNVGSSVHVDHHAMAFHPTDPNIAYFANDGGIYRTMNGGTVFENLNDGYVTLQFYNGTGHAATDSLLSIGGAQDNGSWQWNGTSNWEKVGGGDGSWAAIDPTDPDVQYISSQFLNIRRTTNHWASSSNIAPPSGGATAFIAPFVLAPSEPDRIYAARDRIYRSNNRGTSWSSGPVFDGNAAVGMAVSATDPDVVYVTTAPDRLPSRAGAPTGVHVSRDGGTSWTNITGTLPDRIFMDVAVDPSDDMTAYVVAAGFGAGHVFRTTDGGLTWTDVTGSLPDCPTTAVIVDPLAPSHVFIGNDVGVFHSTDRGQTWQSFNAGLPSAVLVSDLKISPSDRTLRVATHGNGMWKRAIERNPVASEPGAPAERFALEPVAPNPVGDRATVAFRLAETSAVRLSVYDVRGRQVAVLLDAERAAGRHTAVFEASRLAAGTYLVRLEAGGQTRSQTVTVR